MSIQEHLNKIRNAVYGHEVRESIAKGIETAYDDASEKDNANMEVKIARGTHPNLRSRLEEVDNKQQQNTAQLQQKADLADLPSSAYTFKGSTTFAALPTTENTLGDVYYTTDNLVNYSWTGTLWAPIGDGAFSNGSVTSSKLAEGSVSPQKTTFLTVDIGKNRYNENDADVLTDYQISTSGTIVPYATWSVTGHIPVSLGEKLKASYNNNGIRTAVGGRWLAYDVAGNVLTAFSSYGTNVDSFTSNDSSIVSVRFSILSSRFVELQIEKGTTYSNFERYTETAYMPEDYLPTSAYIEPKNATFMDETTGKNILNLNDDEVGPYALNADGTISYNSLRFLSGYIPLKYGESVTVTTLDTATNLRRLRSIASIICYDSDMNPLPDTYVLTPSQYTATNVNTAFFKACFVQLTIIDNTNPLEVMIQYGLTYSTNKGAYEEYNVSYNLNDENIPFGMTNLDFHSAEAIDRMYAIENRIGFEWKPFDTGKIIFQLDDVNTDISTARDLFNTYGIPLSIACITDKMANICDSGETVTEVMETIENNGGEIFSHSIDTFTFNGVTQEDAENRLMQSKLALRKAGFNINGFISPQGVDMYPYLESLSKYYRYSYGGLNSNAPKNFKLERTNIKSVSLSALKTLIDQTATNKGLLILMCHSLYVNEGFSEIYPTFTEADLTAILDYLKYGTDETKMIERTDLELTTIRNVYNQYGSI